MKYAPGHERGFGGPANGQRERPTYKISSFGQGKPIGALQLRLLLPGGEPRSEESALTGPLAEASLAALRFDTAILGFCGFTAAGLTSYDLADAAIKRAMIGSAHRVIAVADPSKLTRTTLAFVAPVNALTVVVTTTDADQEHSYALANAGTVVHQA